MAKPGGTAIGNFFRWLTKLFNGLKSKARVFVPIAIKAVEAVKVVWDTPVDDILAFVVKAAIKGQADDILIDKIKVTVETWLPKILLELKMIDSIVQIENQNEQLKAILAQFKLSSDESKNIFLHGLAVLIAEKLSDGKLTWSESAQIMEAAFKYPEILD